MEQEARALIKRLLEEGERYDDVRRAIISHGYSTDGFEDVYSELQQELGIHEPPPTSTTEERVPNNMMGEDAKHYSSPSIRIDDTSQLVPNIIKIATGILVMVVAVIVLSGKGGDLRERFFGEAQNGSELSAGDVVKKGNLVSYQTSSQIYRDRILDYQGLCQSIGINRAVYNCVENSDAYAIEAPLSDGRFYCIDSTDFSGITETSIGSRASCN